jgi:hypothetical protein
MVFEASWADRLIRPHFCQSISHFIARMRRMGFDPANLVLFVRFSRISIEPDVGNANPPG